MMAHYQSQHVGNRGRGGVLRVQSQPSLHIEFKTSQGYTVRPYPKHKMKTKPEARIASTQSKQNILFEEFVEQKDKHGQKGSGRLAHPRSNTDLVFRLYV